jgi:hypothetical protein
VLARTKWIWQQRVCRGLPRKFGSPEEGTEEERGSPPAGGFGGARGGDVGFVTPVEMERGEGLGPGRMTGRGSLCQKEVGGSMDRGSL